MHHQRHRGEVRNRPEDREKVHRTGRLQQSSSRSVQKESLAEAGALHEADRRVARRRRQGSEQTAAHGEEGARTAGGDISGFRLLLPDRGLLREGEEAGDLLRRPRRSPVGAQSWRGAGGFRKRRFLRKRDALLGEVSHRFLPLQQRRISPALQG